MNLEIYLARMSASAQAIGDLLQSVNDEQARWKPDPDSWSMLEVINHLYDEEREDFRQRIDYFLHRPGEDAPPIHPQKWVKERRYNERELGESLARFQTEREASLKWLHGLPSPNWDAEYRHPVFGVIRAGDLLGAWVAHDMLHIRQLNELHYAYLVRSIAPYKVEYAGEW
jgi:hypothetical protein